MWVVRLQKDFARRMRYSSSLFLPPCTRARMQLIFDINVHENPRNREMYVNKPDELLRAKPDKKTFILRLAVTSPRRIFVVVSDVLLL